MTSSFADAVRGGGQPLAGKPPEVDDAWSGKANPLEAMLRCPTTLSHVPVLRALIARCGPDAISCVRSVSATNFAVTCSSETGLLLLIDNPVIDIEKARCTVSRAGEPLRSVTLRNVPFDATDDDLRALLQPYASLLEWTHEVYKDFPGIANGNRRLHIKMPKPLPNFLTFRKKRVIVSYNGVQLLCFKCGSPDHEKKNCPKMTSTLTPHESKAADPTDPVLDASKSMPPPETPTKVNKKRKPNASPAPSESPSPRSRKRQPLKSPIVATASPLPSPSARLKRSASANSLTPSRSPSGRSPKPNQDPTAVETMQMLEFHERAFKLYLKADDDGMHFRPGVEAFWIRYWCPTCWENSDNFSSGDCRSTPACEGRDVTNLGLPKPTGKHLLILGIKDGKDEYDLCCVDVGHKRWNILPFDAQLLLQYRGPPVPEYASAPT